MNPDCNFYNNINSKCNYYTEQQFDANVNDVHGLSIINFNVRGLNANFLKIVDYLDELAFKFDIVAITETWIQSECATDFQLNEYELFSVQAVCRKMKGGGGVALYIRKDIHCKLLSAKSFECVTVELSVSKPMRKTVTISCIYRTPGSNIDMFIESLDKIFTGNKPKTSMFICGDFNIDLLQYEEHVGSAKFIDTMYSNGLYPLIDKPTRITQQSATLIDNIFTNDMNHDIICGLLINDISDHLPVFSISGHDYLITKNNLSSIFLDPVLEQDIIATVNSCKSKTSCDFNGIDMKVVKKVVSYIAKPLSDICNKSFTQGVFPDNMKIGKVIPLYKAGDRNVFSNYRPISLLSQFSKILEKLFNERLDKFIDKCNVLNNSQYGFRLVESHKDTYWDQSSLFCI